MARRIILIFACILSIYFNAFVSIADECVEGLEPIIANITANDLTIREIQKTFYPLDNKPAPHYVKLYYCFMEPCNSTAYDYEYYWTDNDIFMVLGYYLFKALTFERVDIGEIRGLYFHLPKFCNSSKTAGLLLNLTLKVTFIITNFILYIPFQLPIIVENDNISYYADYLQKVNKQSRNYDFDKAKIVISTWLIFATLGCLIAVHVLMCMKGAREHLGKLLKRFVSNYYKSIMIIDKKKSSLSQFEDEKIFFFFIERIAFPVMLVAVVIITCFDIYLYGKYHTLYYDKRSFYLFPIPCVAPSIFVVNLVISVATATKMFWWDKLKAKLIECCDKLKRYWDKLMKREKTTSPLERNEGQKQLSYNIEETIAENEQESSYNLKDKLKQHCQKFIRFATLVLLFGIVYLFYHSFWIIIALLVYPEKFLVGGIFIVPLLMLIVIPIWNTIIKIAQNWFDTCNESSCCKGCVWLAVLVYEIVFWGLFIVMLHYASTFFISYDSRNLEIKTYQLVFFYITIAAVSGILTWFNTELVIYSHDNRENQDEPQQDNEENQDEPQQDNEENQDEPQQDNEENQDEPQQDNEENQVEQ